MKQPVPLAQQRLDVSNRAGAADTAYEKPLHYTIFLYCHIISLSLNLVHSEVRTYPIFIL